MQDKKDYSELRHRIFTIVGIVLCVILVPMLIINCTLLIKGWTNSDEVPSIGGVSVMIVMTPSMEGDAEDCFNAGDLVFIKMAEPDEIEKGQVITFYDPDGTGTSVLTHRVIDIYEKDGKTYFQTKGDANPTADPSPAPAENLIGIYTGVRIPGAGNVAMFMQSTTGLIVCVLIPLVAFVAYDIIRRRLYDKKHNDDKDELLRELEELRRLKAAADAADAESSGEDVGVEKADAENAPAEETNSNEPK